ncbi:hypothetical protein ON010_g2663 [Phytophthora cinnamomi]|nr:hypothetical protein ON010_g2663 [Phytophthora cinnamomi]
MGRSKVPPNVFAPLKLSTAEKQAIVDYTDELVAETLLSSEKFIARHRKLNPERWKYVKTQDHLHVYRSRRRKSSAEALEPPQLVALSEMSSGSFASSDSLGASRVKASTSSGGSGASHRHDADYLTDRSLLERARPDRVPLIVVTGKMEGTVEDAAFGALADNEARWRLRDAYIGDEYDDQKILATLEAPSEGDPFRFLGVKWATKTMGTFITQRDMVYVESTGIARDSNGEKVAFMLMHSYALDRVPELSEFGVIRARVSSCVIMRSHSERTVEVFLQSFQRHGRRHHGGRDDQHLQGDVAGCGRTRAVRIRQEAQVADERSRARGERTRYDAGSPEPRPDALRWLSPLAQQVRSPHSDRSSVPGLPPGLLQQMHGRQEGGRGYW